MTRIVKSFKRLKMVKLLIVVLFASFDFAIGITEEHAGDEDTRKQQAPACNPEEMFQDMFPLTNENFTLSLLRNKDPWIVIFHDGSVEREWKKMATDMRGLCWFGLIDVTTEKELISKLEYDKSQASTRFYPYGDRKTKERKWRAVGNQNEARLAALSSFPDTTQRMSGDGVHDFFLDCYMSKPSKFPAYIITDEDDTPSVFKVIAKRFEKYFTFGRVVRPTTDDLRKLGLGDIYINPPALFVIITHNGKADKTNAIQFDTDKLGSMNYTMVMQFMFAINGQYRHELPGDNMALHEQEAEMSDIIKIEEKRFAIRHSDGSETNANKKHIEEEETNLNLKVTSHVGLKDEL